MSHLADGDEQTVWRLYSGSIAPATQRMYFTAKENFYKFCTAHHHSTQTNDDLDHALSMYMAALYNATGSKAAGNMALYGVLFYRPSARTHMHISTGVMRGWSRLVPSVSHPPLTWPLAVLIAATMARRLRLDAAMATLVGFDCFLRISEYVAFHIEDVALPTDPRLGATMVGARTVLRIQHAKTGSNQSVEIYNNDITTLLTRFIHRRCTRQRAELTSPLFRLRSESDYRRMFKDAIRDLGIQHIHFVPHSLRHGGATHALRLGYDINTVMQRGRWRSTSSADLYLQQANAARLGTQIRQSVHQSAQALSDNFVECMNILLFPEDHTVSRV
jgi:integrase